MLCNLLDAWFVLDDDDVLEVSLAARCQLVDPLGSAGTEPDGEFVRISIGSVFDVMAFQVAMETLYNTMDIYRTGIPWAYSVS